MKLYPPTAVTWWCHLETVSWPCFAARFYLHPLNITDYPLSLRIKDQQNSVNLTIDYGQGEVSEGDLTIDYGQGELSWLVKAISL